MWELFLALQVLATTTLSKQRLTLVHCITLVNPHTHFVLKRAGSSYLGQAMSANPYTNTEPHLQQTYQEDVKSSFDDLVDPYAAPFSPISRHQTYTVGTPLNQQRQQSHQKTPSLPLSSKAHSSKQSEDQ